jgi:hypothetical protein
MEIRNNRYKEIRGDTRKSRKARRRSWKDTNQGEIQVNLGWKIRSKARWKKRDQEWDE